MANEKIVAVQMDCECFDWEAYYNEDMAQEDMFTAKGGRELEFNVDLWKDTIELMEDLASDYDTIQFDDSYASEEDKEADLLDTVKQHVKNFLYNQDAADDVYGKLADEAFWKILKFADTYYNSSMHDADAVADMLTLIYSKKFVTGTMHGCCQGDWCEYVCPADMSQDMLDYIEAVLFGTGTEYRISETPIDVEGKDVEELMDEVDGPCDYTACWKDDDIKEWIAKNASYGDVQYTKDDVMLIQITGSHTVTVNSYSIA